MLDLGILDIDASYVLSGANVPFHGAIPQPHESRPCLMIAGLLFHPDKGLILLDTGSLEDIIKYWDKEFLECAPRIWDKGIHFLPEAIKATGAGKIGDVKAVVMSYLHLDHAGGLEHFFGTDVEIWCHKYELKNVF
ncbi:Metallo-hydrolase/oxidoreductase [Penicillium robsamsonii]|uniref:Metallo-hydrolase/oxidoreductase n=1 Tax=Penicillium robsamsonii TaxID=1792511 RepID=UPI0025492395|nr:Metallo-hydrolase/oxidoreductase [Penicillium robsamsonii]KAJ5817044.1 Metallo-hydrolase/oxidoreductase [Penicillium robsamsonii]